MNAHEIAGNIIMGIIILNVVAFLALNYYLEKNNDFDAVGTCLLLWIFIFTPAQVILFHVVCFVLDYFFNTTLLIYRS